MCNHSQNDTKNILKKTSRKYERNFWNFYKIINKTIQTPRQLFGPFYGENFVIVFGRFCKNILPEGGCLAGGGGVSPEGGYMLVHGVELPFIDTQLTVRHLLFIPGGCTQLSWTQKVKNEEENISEYCTGTCG